MVCLFETQKRHNTDRSLIEPRVGKNDLDFADDGLSFGFIYLAVPTAPTDEDIYERLDPPLVDVLVRGGSRDGKVNEAEAQAIVSEIKVILADPRFDKRTIGVVSLLGFEQAHHIFDLIREQIDDEDIVERKITVGDARTFQGKERDVMMLSMVATAEAKATATGRVYEQRFNVAASRARDRMYLFRSVDISALNKNDLKARLIGHFQSPFHQDPVRARDLRARCQSGFEREMFDVLVERGYRMTPQVPAGGYYIDLVVEGEQDRRLAIECDGDQYHGPGQWAADMARQRVLERAGWTFWRCFASSFTIGRQSVLDDLFSTLKRMGIEPTKSDASDVSGYTEHREADPLGVSAALNEAGGATVSADAASSTLRPDSSSTKASELDREQEIPTNIAQRNANPGASGKRIQDVDVHSPAVLSRQYSDEALREFLSSRSLRSEDNRNKNGALWVFVDNPSLGIIQQLKTWGFQLKVGKGWWKK